MVTTISKLMSNPYHGSCQASLNAPSTPASTTAGAEEQTQMASPEEIASSLGGSVRSEKSMNLDKPAGEPVGKTLTASPPSPTSSLPSSASRIAKPEVL